MNVKRVKRMCSVKGCRNTDTYALSKIKEWGGVIICKDCLISAIKATKNPQKAEAKSKGADAPIFYHPTAKATGAELKEAIAPPVFDPSVPFLKCAECSNSKNGITNIDSGGLVGLCAECVIGKEVAALLEAETKMNDDTEPPAPTVDPPQKPRVEPIISATDYDCPICKKVCKSQIGLNSHMRTHGDKDNE